MGGGRIFSVATGIVGVFLIIVYFVHFLKNYKKINSFYYLFFLSLSIFSLISAYLSVLLNLSYMDFRNIKTPPNLEYFLSSRYLITTSGFWIGLTVICFYFINLKKIIVISICLILSSFAAIFNKVVLESKIKLQNFIETKKMEEILISIESKKKFSYNKLLILDLSLDSQAQEILSRQKILRLGPFAPTLTKINNKLDIRQPINITDYNWDQGYARNWSGFAVINLHENKLYFSVGKKIKFSNNQTRLIVNQVENDNYLNIFLDNNPSSHSYFFFSNKPKILNE
jgi:hypothetical protein